MKKGKPGSIPEDAVVTNGDLIRALNRANKLIDWMAGYIGNMAPGSYSECFADLNEHFLFMGRHGGTPPKKGR